MRSQPLVPRWSSLWDHEPLYWVARTHVIAATGAIGGLPTWPRSAVLGGADACDHSCLGLRWCSLWGHEALPRNAVLGGAEAC
eukprot:5706326-Pyramimonas_sp.AAC.1